MGNRRNFLKKSAALVSLATIPDLLFSEELKAAVAKANTMSPAALAEDETFWATI